MANYRKKGVNLALNNFTQMNQNYKISFREASIRDRRLIFYWRNLEEIIALSSTQEAVTWDEHMEWFSELTKNPKKFILIIEKEAVSIGQVHFKVIKKGIASISIYLRPQNTGKGLGAYLIRESCIIANKKLASIKQINAEILIENHRSIRAFKKAGFNITNTNKSGESSEKCITLIYTI